MIITGNSNVSCFRQQGLVTSSSAERVDVCWVGALRIEHFFDGHPAGTKVRELFRAEPGWKLLSIGVHDLYELFKSAAAGSFAADLDATIERYQRLFGEFQALGKFGWLVFPQPLHVVAPPELTGDELANITRNFHQRIEQWCRTQGVTVVDPQAELLGSDHAPLGKFLQRDGLHLNPEGTSLYLAGISAGTGLSLTFQAEPNSFEPRSEVESFCSLLLDNLGIPFQRGLCRAELQQKLIDFVSLLLIDRGIPYDVDAATELVDSGLLDSLSLVEVYSFAVKALQIEIPFEVNLRELGSIGKLAEFLFAQEQATAAAQPAPLTQSDFIVSLRGAADAGAEPAEILEADRRIGAIDGRLLQQFREDLVVAGVGEHCPYGVVFFWIALAQAQQGDYQSALASLALAASPEKSFPFISDRSNDYRSQWEALAAGMERGPQYSVTAIVSTYNGERFMHGCLQNLTTQTLFLLNELEILVIDSGSQQGERAIVEQFQESHPQIVYLRTERETLYAAWNRGIRTARGAYLTNANTDDRHRSDALEVMYRALLDHPEIDLVYGDCYVSTTPNETYAENGKSSLYRYPDFSPPDSLLYFQFGPQPMWKKSVHQLIGYFDEQYKAAGDYDFNIRFALHCQARHIPEPLGLYLEHQNALSFMDNTAVLENHDIKNKYRSMATIEALYGRAGFPTETVEDKTHFYLDLGIRALEFYPPWFGGRAESDTDFALQCLAKASSLAPVWPPQWDAQSSARVSRGMVTARALFESFLSKLPPELKMQLLHLQAPAPAPPADTGQLFPFSALAKKYCVGRGLEIGGSAHNPFGLDSLNVDFCGDADTIFKEEEIRLCGRVMPVDIVARGDEIPLPDASQDFVVSSHVLEHFPDPVRALLEWDRLVKPGGVIFMIVPHMERTFDRTQPRTTLQHLIDDFRGGSLHCDFDPHRHYHHWITEDILALCRWMIEEFGLAWTMAEAQDTDDKVGNGFTVVIRKEAARKLPARAELASVPSLPGSVLFVVHGFPPEAVGGVEVYTRNLAEEMAARGVRVTVLYPVTDASGPDYSFSSEARQGLTLVKFHVPRGNIFSSIVSREIEGAFRAFLAATPFELVHFHHVFEHMSISMIAAAKEAGLPVALTLHDFWLICPRAQLYIEEFNTVCWGPQTPNKCAQCMFSAKWYPGISEADLEETITFRQQYVRTLLPSVDLLFAPSQFVADLYRRYGFADDIAVAPLGIKDFTVNRSPSGAVTRFGYLGTIHPVKNILTLAIAFGTTSGPARLEIYGGGESHNIDKLRLCMTDARISYHGGYAFESLPEILAGIDVLVVPSLVESYCFTVREALHAGIPVLAARVGGIPEVVRDGVNGLLFDPNDPQELATLLQRFIDEPGLAKSLDAHAVPVMTIAADAQFLLERYATRLPPSGTPSHGPGASKPADKLNVGVFSLDAKDHACGHYRIQAPLRAIAEGVDFSWGVDINEKGFFFNPAVAAEAADLIVVQRFFPRAETMSFLEFLLSRGKQIVFEIDDLLTQLPESNPSHHWGMQCSPYIYDLVRQCAAVTVSTAVLRDHFLAYNDAVYLLPNLLDSDLWCKTSPPSSGPVVIGYAGTVTHASDLAMLEEVLERIAARHGNGVAFTFMGCATERIARLPGIRYIQFETTFEAYARTLQETPIDIMLVPLEDNPFNRCKSNIKWLEYSSCGFAGIYADLPPYNDCVTHGKDGLLVGNDPGQWHDAIDLLISHPELRKSLADQARRTVLASFTVKKGAHRWLDAYREIAGKGAKQASAPPARSVSIVIPLFNNVEYTRRCLAAVAAHTPEGLYELVLVDNGSSDATDSLLATLPASVKVIRNETNQGFAKACNQGARATTGDYLLFLNNDTEPCAGWLEALLQSAGDDPQLAAVGSKLLFADGTIQHAGVVIADDRATPDPLLARHVYYGFPSDHPAANLSREYQALTAACLLVRSDAFWAVQGFDQGYWNGYEDVDLCFKLRQTGRKLLYQPASVVVHHESKSGSERFSKAAQNIQRLHLKWLDKIQPDLIIHADRREQWLSDQGPFADAAPVVSIVIPLFNQVAFTRQCLSALFQVTGDTIPYEVIVVDNGSSDGTAEYLQGQDRIRVLSNDRNLGFAKACNQGAQAARGRYLVLLNNDTLPQPGWLQALVEGAQIDGADLVGAKLLYADGRVQHAGVGFADPGVGMHVFKGMPGDHPAVNRKRFMQCVTGACLLIERRLFLEFDGFDEGFVNGYEDIDLCLRAGAAGKKILYNPRSVLVHFEESSAGRKDKDRQNAERFTARWGGRIRFDDLELYEQEGLLSPIGDQHADRLWQLLGANDNAVFIYLNVLSRYPEDAGALLNLGRAYAAHARVADARFCLDRLLAVHPGHRLALRELDLLQAGGDGDGVISD